MAKKWKKMSPEERAAWKARDAYLEARIRQLREAAARAEARLTGKRAEPRREGETGPEGA